MTSFSQGMHVYGAIVSLIAAARAFLLDIFTCNEKDSKP